MRDDCKDIDLVEIDSKLMHSQAVIGTVPLLSKSSRKLRSSFFKVLIYGVKKFFSIELQRFKITTANGREITTAGSAIIIFNHIRDGFVSKMFDFDESIRDGKVTIVIISPFSILEYIKLLMLFFVKKPHVDRLPKSIGYIKSESFYIEASKSKRVYFDDGGSTPLPVSCKIIPNALKLNASEKFWQENKRVNSDKETIKIANLPDASEVDKYSSSRIPLFRVASEERFKELFQALRVDAKLNSMYLVLMMLSTLLATFGLFSNSTAVIIGAMLVAPLMTPIVSVSMGLLRADSQIIRDSLLKISVGVFVALLASCVLSYLLPYSEMTNEIKSRINPTLLDLGVAIFSGIAAAYSKSFKEITQNLAGVAIAVALVPPLAVAGIGLGHGELYVFMGAFLLFFTNLVGIIISAVLTFQVLGFSNALKSKKSVSLIFVLLLAVSYPLYLSYDKMIQRYQISSMLKEHTFVVHDKKIVIDSISVAFKGDMKILNLDLLVKESLDKSDLEEFREKIKELFNSKLSIKARIEYML